MSPALEPLDEAAILDAALRFRSAIVGALPLGDIVMDNFPRGTCGDTAILLGEFFYREGLGVWLYRSGYKGGHTHAWISQDGLIVDITADQFPGFPPAAVTRDSKWYDGFTPISGDGVPALISTYDEQTRRRLSSVYDRIVRATR